MPEHTRHAAREDQVAWATKQLIQDLAEYVDAQANRLAHSDITFDHVSEETAATVVEEFRKGTSHSLDAWADVNTAMADVQNIISALGLTLGLFQLLLQEILSNPEHLTAMVLNVKDITANQPQRTS